jgi:hypothetical protein
MFLSMMLYAGNTGKISGFITDEQSGEPMIGVNISVKDKPLGAASDENGFYYILQLPPGKYQLEFSYIGYHSVTITNVRVNVDLTTTINVKMISDLLETDAIIVEAEKPIIQRDITSTKRTTSRDEMMNLPGMEQSLDMFRLQGGTVMSNQPQAIQLADGTHLEVRDESIKDVHVRGGRGGEILYMVDGSPVTHPVYGGRSVIDLNVNDVEEIELLTGAFNAEYGQAQSGVINITTRSGANYFEGGIEYKSDLLELWGPSYNTHYSSLYISGPELLSNYILPRFGINLPGKLSFFISANGTITDTQYNNFRTRETISLLGLEFNERQDNKGNFNIKIDWLISPQIRFALSYHGSWNKWSRFSWPWKDFPDHMVDYQRDNQNISFRFTHTLSNSTFYSLSFGYLEVDYRASKNGARPHEFWTFIDTSGVEYDYYSWEKWHAGEKPAEMKWMLPPIENDLTHFYDGNSVETMWRDDDTRSFTLRSDITSQIFKEHLMKIGIDLQYHDIQYVDIQDGGSSLSKYGEYKYKDGVYEPAPPGPDPEFGRNRWVFHAFPFMGGIYIQDKFEKESLIINAGIRFDWFMPGDMVYQDDYVEQWEKISGLEANWSKVRSKISPRFGISFPISLETVIFFSYGHFNQLPEMQYYYRDPYSSNFIGNPGLDFEQTVLYEFGFTHQLFRSWSIDIKSYAKDISQQVGTTTLRSGQTSGIYDNNGYARARGLEFRLEKHHSGYISGSLNYTVQWATGYTSSAFEDYINSINFLPNPIRERRLNWDVRHQIVFLGAIVIPKDRRPEIFGWQIPGNWDASMIFNFSSGMPYTPYTNYTIDRQTKYNTLTGPSITTTDLKFQKHFNLSNGINLSLMLDVFNIFDQNNTQINYGFNNVTGKPYVFSDLDPDGNYYEDFYRIYRSMDPRQFSTGRYVKLGLRISWRTFNR